MNNRRWTNNELLLLAEYFPKGDLSILSSKIGRSLSSIHGKASRIGLKRIVKGNNCPDKKCIKCQKIKPRTSEYFFTKISEGKMADGTIKKYKCYRSLCKDCHKKDTHLRTQKKKAQEKGMTLKEYQEWCNWFMKEGISTIAWESHQYKYKFLDDLGIPLRSKRTIIKWMLNGYNWKGLKQYKLDALNLKIETHKKRRKYKDLPKGYNFYYELPNDLKNKILRSRKPTKGVIANWLGIKVNELDLETEKTKRLLHDISRFIKIEEGKNELCA